MPKKKKTSSKISKALKRAAAKKPEGLLWKGPESEDKNGGITQSMLGAFLVCRERFRIKYIEGLSPTPTFSHQLEYGNMWHICEEALGKFGNNPVEGYPVWLGLLLRYTSKLGRKYPLQKEQIFHWYNVCKLQFEIYLKQPKDKDQKQRKPLLPEQTFSVPYKLPSGRMVILRGKWDGVDLFGTKRKPELWLWENKTKGDIDEQATDKQLTFDLQTMFYVVALWERLQVDSANNSLLSRDYGPLQGFWYNVIRRPLSGGAGSIRPHKEKVLKNKTVPAETMEHFYDRLKVIIEENPENFFYRWKVRISRGDVDKFKTKFLNPILEQLCIWYDNAQHPWDFPSYHWRHPYGVWNPMDQGRKSDVDEYLLTGSKLGLVQTTLFGELE